MKTVHKKSGNREKETHKHLVDHPIANVFFNKPGEWLNKKLLNDFISIKEEKSVKERSSDIMFFSLSLCFSLLLIIYAFEWRTTDETETIATSQNTSGFDDLVEVPQTKMIQKPPAISVTPEIIEVADEKIIENIELNLDIEMSEDTRIEEIIFQPQQTTSNIPEERADEIFVIVEEQPSPIGGMQEFYKYVSENLKYPVRAARMGIEGRVFIEFIVEKDGSLTDIKVAKGIGGGCDEEAIRVISEAPKWDPGKQRGRPVRVRMIMPIAFKIL